MFQETKPKALRTVSKYSINWPTALTQLWLLTFNFNPHSKRRMNSRNSRSEPTRPSSASAFCWRFPSFAMPPWADLAWIQAECKLFPGKVWTHGCFICGSIWLPMRRAHWWVTSWVALGSLGSVLLTKEQANVTNSQFMCSSKAGTEQCRGLRQLPSRVSGNRTGQHQPCASWWLRANWKQWSKTALHIKPMTCLYSPVVVARILPLKDNKKQKGS